MDKKVFVIKLGTAIISDDAGNINIKVIGKLAKEIAGLSQHYHVVIVSSGAVGSGKAFVKNYEGTLTQRKAAAAVGNPILIRLYHKYFYKYGITVAQALCERHHFANRQQFLQLKETFEEFWRNNIVPVVNENDLVSNVELKFSDNDELATLIAVGFNADILVICTKSGGLLDADKNIIPIVQKIDAVTFGYVTKDKSNTGLGGMLSKLTSAKLAVSLGIKVVICGLDGGNPISDAIKGNKGTTFSPRQSNLKARQKWLASGSISPGSIAIDDGAFKALQLRKSLLAVGIKEVNGNFIAGEVVQLLTKQGESIGVAKSKLSSAELATKPSLRNTVAAHADDIVLF